MASSVAIGKLHCGLKLCRDTVLMSRHSLAFWGSDTIFGVVTRPGHGREALCRDRAGLASRQGARSRRSARTIWHMAHDSVQSVCPVRANCAHEPPVIVHCVVH